VSGRRNHPKHPAKRSRFGKPTRKRDRPARSACGKVGYRDKEEALWWLGKLVGGKIRAGVGKPLETRVYKCPVCVTLWHTTSQPRKTDPGY
jgi:hypothetical protein